MKKSILTIALITLASVQAFAHYLWVETNPNGNIGQEQEVKVHFGEYTYGVIEKTEGEAFLKMTNFTLWAVSPSGEKTLLRPLKKDTYYSASFTPTEQGTYTVLLNNNNIDVIDYTQYDFGIFKTHYHAMASVLVGHKQNETVAQNVSGLALKQLPTEQGEIKLQVLYKGIPLEKNEVKIYVADLWSKTLETDENGQVSFKQPWDTKYIVETTFKENEPGTYNGEDYEFIWHCATFCTY